METEKKRVGSPLKGYIEVAIRHCKRVIVVVVVFRRSVTGSFTLFRERRSSVSTSQDVEFSFTVVAFNFSLGSKTINA